jgi:DNA-directed RNA polymerase specialized sigma subunit
LTEGELRQYRHIKLEIRELDSRVNELLQQGQQMFNTKVKGSLSCFPYTPARFNVEGPDENAIKRQQMLIDELVWKRERKKEELLEKENEIYDFINSIEDPELRLIFTYTFLKGMNQEKVAIKVFMDRSTVSRRISQYFKSCTACTK